MAVAVPSSQWMTAINELSQSAGMFLPDWLLSDVLSLVAGDGKFFAWLMRQGPMFALPLCRAHSHFIAVLEPFIRLRFQNAGCGPMLGTVSRTTAPYQACQARMRQQPMTANQQKHEHTVQ